MLLKQKRYYHIFTENVNKIVCAGWLSAVIISAAASNPVRNAMVVNFTFYWSAKVVYGNGSQGAGETWRRTIK